jgi:hypothetical protein
VTRYLISFDDGAMTFPEEGLPDVAEAAHAVVQEARDAGVWVFGAGLGSLQPVWLGTSRLFLATCLLGARGVEASLSN